MKVTLIRHTSVNVPKGVCYGQTDVPLNDTFCEEAEIVAKSLSGKTFDKVFVSPLSRCFKLSDHCGYVDATRDDRLKELDFGDWEMKRFDEIADPRLEEWFNDFLNVPVTGGESFMMQYARVASFLDELNQQNYKHVAVFAHGGVLICARVYAGELELNEAFRELSPYGAVIEIDI